MTINIQANYSLKDHNTLGFEQSAEFYCAPENDAQLEAALTHAQQNKLQLTVLGGGSNLVLTSNIEGLVIRPAYQHLRTEPGDQPDATFVHAGAGIVWNDLVEHTLKLGLQGLENLTLIPGSVGAAPVQNIGAYGVEVEQRIVSVKAMHLPSRQWQTFSPEQCRFSYRDSYFKHHPRQYLITDVCFRLGPCNALNYQYETLAHYLRRHSYAEDSQAVDSRGEDKCAADSRAENNDTTAAKEPDAVQISQAVAAIRSSRLPDPATLGNVGSFFHNPIVSNDQAAKLRQQFADMPVYPSGEHNSKLSAAWLIDNAGLKGYRQHAVGVYDKQALVLVNYGGGDGEQLMGLAAFVKKRIKQDYDVDLQIEPTIL